MLGVQAHARDARGHRALVIGGGLAGLMAGAVLAPHFKHVVIVEKQRRETLRLCSHGLRACWMMAGGASALSHLLPGLTTELLEEGGQKSEPQINSLRHSQRRVALAGWPQEAAELPFHIQSLAHLTAAVQKRISAKSNITQLFACEIVELLLQDSRDAVASAVLKRRTGGANTFDVDFVVDASGARPFLPQIISRLGQRPIPQLRSEINLNISTFEAETDAPIDISPLLALHRGKDGKTDQGALALRPDARRLQISLFRYGRSQDSKTIDQIDETAFSEHGLGEESALALRLDKFEKVDQSNYASVTWRRYDRANWGIRNAVAIGDSLCRLDPISGYDVNTVMLSAEVLARALNRTGVAGAEKRSKAAQAYLRDVATLVEVPWQLQDAFRIPISSHVEGYESVRHRANRWILRRALDGRDPRLTRQAARVGHLLDRPNSLLGPLLNSHLFPHRPAADLARQDGTSHLS